MGSTQLDENFFYNSMLAKAMVQMLPPNGKLWYTIMGTVFVSFRRKVIRLWFDKLMQTDKTRAERNKKRICVFILLMLQCKKVREPFNGAPPPELEPLRISW
nr:unnamed protein product [Callosobruchus analis]